MDHMSPFVQLRTLFWTQALPPQFQPDGAWAIEMLGLSKEPALRVRCDIPEDCYCFRVTVQEPLGQSGYSVSIFGYRAGASAPSDAPRFALLGEPDSIVLLAAQRCVRHVDTALWLEALWRPETGSAMALHGLEHRHRSRELPLIRHGLAMLRRLEMGRNRETSRYYPKDKFLTKYPPAYCKAQHRRDSDPVRQEDVAQVMSISLETFKRCLADYHCPWPPVLS